jgi:hypothetical protein
MQLHITYSQLVGELATRKRGGVSTAAQAQGDIGVPDKVHRSASTAADYQPRQGLES